MPRRMLCGLSTTLVVAVAAFCPAWVARTAEAAIVEAEQWTNVLVEAPLFDSRPAAVGGCDPAGCLGTLTRDGDSLSPDSRWSCSPSLGPADSECYITFEMKKKLDVKGLRVAFHKGNTGARVKMLVSVNGEQMMEWTSSGQTAGYEFIPIVSTRVNLIELRGVLDPSEWIGISEVEILAESVHDEEMMQAAMEVALNDAIDYNMKPHAFHAGRPQPLRTSRVTLVTQCSADRLGAVMKQATLWGGDVSLAVLIPSAPVWETSEALMGVKKLVEDLDKAYASDPSLSYLSVDIALLEGAEGDPSKQDHCGPLYPVNTLRNLALLQTRNEELHPAPVVFLVDSDFAPSANLRGELGAADVQKRLLEGFQQPSKKPSWMDSVPPLGAPADVESEESEAAEEEAPSGPHKLVAAVVPCMEFVDGENAPDLSQMPLPRTPEEAANLLSQGLARGFHVHRVAASHAPTDFDRWARESRNTTGGGLAYTIPYYPRFEPYVAVAKEGVPLYDERFRGYANNKLAHILALSLGGYPKPPSQQSGSSSVLDTNSYPPGKEAYSVDMSEAARPKRAGAEFVVVRRGFVFHQPHPASHAWEATYGGERDALRAYQIRHLWLTFLTEVRAGVPPAISANTLNLLLSMRIRNPPLGRVVVSPTFVNLDHETGTGGRWLAFRRDASYLVGGQRRTAPVDADALTGEVSSRGVKSVGLSAARPEQAEVGSGGSMWMAQWLRTAVCLAFFVRIMMMGRARWCSS